MNSTWVGVETHECGLFLRPSFNGLEANEVSPLASEANKLLQLTAVQPANEHPSQMADIAKISPAWTPGGRWAYNCLYALLPIVLCVFDIS